MYHPVQTLRQKVTGKIESGEINIGMRVVQTPCSRYTAHEGDLRQESTDVYAHKIPLLEIRERLLQ